MGWILLILFCLILWQLLGGVQWCCQLCRILSDEEVGVVIENKELTYTHRVVMSKNVVFDIIICGKLALELPLPLAASASPTSYTVSHIIRGNIFFYKKKITKEKDHKSHTRLNLEMLGGRLSTRCTNKKQYRYRRGSVSGYWELVKRSIVLLISYRLSPRIVH